MYSGAISAPWGSSLFHSEVNFFMRSLFSGERQWPLGPLVSDRSDILTSSLKLLNGIQRNLTGSKITTFSTKSVFFGLIEKTRWRPSLWLAETFLTSPLKPLNDINVLYQDYVFRTNRKNKMAAPAHGWLRHFRLLFFNRWTEFNETWQELRFQCSLPSLCFWTDWKNKMAALVSDWLRHFRLLWNHWTDFNDTGQEARSRHPLPNLWFLGRSEKQDGSSALICWDIFYFSKIQRSLTGSDILASSTKFVFGGWSEKQDGCLVFDWLKHFRLLLWNRWTEFNKTSQEARSQRHLRSLCYSDQSEKQGGLPDQSVKEWHIVLRCTTCGPFRPMFDFKFTHVMS